MGGVEVVKGSFSLLPPTTDCSTSSTISDALLYLSGSGWEGVLESFSLLPPTTDYCTSSTISDALLYLSGRGWEGVLESFSLLPPPYRLLTHLKQIIDRI